MAWVNAEMNKAGRIRAVCEMCDRRSKYTDADVNPYSKTSPGPQPDFWALRGWSETPFPDDFVHDDGSTGSCYTCPPCNRKAAQGAWVRSVRGFSVAVIG